MTTPTTPAGRELHGWVYGPAPEPATCYRNRPGELILAIERQAVSAWLWWNF